MAIDKKKKNILCQLQSRLDFHAISAQLCFWKGSNKCQQMLYPLSTA